MDGLNYAMMDPCMRVGISGGCGDDCPVLLEGECPLVKEEEEEARGRIKRITDLVWQVFEN